MKRLWRCGQGVFAVLFANIAEFRGRDCEDVRAVLNESATCLHLPYQLDEIVHPPVHKDLLEAAEIVINSNTGCQENGMCPP